MTTRKTPPPADRVRRTPPGRKGPDRSGTAARATATAAAPAAAVPPPGSAPGNAPGASSAAPPSDSATIDEAVASSVKAAYDVLAESIEQGRRSAAHFRQGEYNIRDVPGDVRHLAANILRLARQLSETTFEVCEALLSQPAAGVGAPPPPGTTPVPPFREPQQDPVASRPAPPPPAAAPDAAAAAMPLSVVFEGVQGAVSHTAFLARPVQPIFAEQISAAPLAPRADGAALTQVRFATLTDGGLVATVTVPDGQPGGVYSGAVFAPGQDLPLGLLVVELPQGAASPRG